MAAVDTPYDLRLQWNPQGRFPATATAVHGIYHVTGDGPYDVFYRATGSDQTEKLATGLSDPYHHCVDHNKARLAVIGPVTAAPPVGRNERTCGECGTIHAGQC